jgi:methylthioribulose 1-phosphate dehydratase/enolase-phosphatase E1
MVPLWFLVYKLRPSANCVVHTHSMNSQLATLLCEDEDNKVLRLTHLEMLKGVGNHAYDDVLEIPIIENRRSEDLLAPQLEEAIKAYPKCNAVLVRRHGLYLWGDSWQQAKTQCESFEFLFETAIKMRSIGKDASMPPPAKAGKRKSDGIEESHVEKRRKMNGVTAVQPAFNGVMAVDNDMDLTLEKRNMVPLVPKDCKIILLDIEGCTTAISFVKDVLFPYVLNNIDSYLKPLSDTDTSGFLEALKKDVDTMKDPDVKSKCDAINGNFDTTSGGKKEAQSYRNIAESLGVKTSEICFVSDAEAELVAAREAGIGFVVMSVRPGNAPMTEVGYEFPRVFSLMQLCGC